MSRFHHAISGTRRSQLRRDVLAAAGGRCEVRLSGICTDVATDLEHIVPLSQGGHPTDPSNLRASCRPCNRELMALRPRVANPWGV